METFKLKFFEKEHGFKFPDFDTVGNHESDALKISLAKEFGIAKENFIFTLRDKQSVLGNINGENVPTP